MSTKFLHRLGVGAALSFTLLGSSAALAAPPEREEADNASLRARAKDEWYNEAYRTPGRRQGGPWSPAYRRFMLDAANRERARWGQVRTNPDGSLSLTLTGLGAAIGSNWVNLGPTRADFLRNGSYTLNRTDAGRIRSIVTDPVNASRMFVATSGGGVWRTLDGGTTWTAITEGLGSLSCGSLAMDPSNSSVLYLGLGDPFDGTGVGLVKSTDGGSTWSSPVYLGNSTVITQVMVAPANPNIVLATTDQGIFRSTDAGATWSLVNIATGQADAPYGWSIAWTGGSGFAVSLEAAYAATSGTTDGQIWITADNGATWTRASGVTITGGVGRITVASAPSNRQTLYAMAAVPNATTSTDLADIFRSTNGGATWTALGAARRRYSNRNTESSSVGTLLNGQGWYDQLVAVHPTNPNTVYFGGALLLARTTDGGTSFSQTTNWLGQFSLPYVHADFHAAAFNSAGALFIGTDGGVFRSTDNGVTWTDSLNVGLTTHLLYSVGSSPANRAAVIGGLQDNGTRLRSGETSTFNQVIGGDGFGSDIHPTNAQMMLGSLYYTRIYRSTNGGSSFTQSCSGIAECGGSNAPFYTKIAPWAGDATGNTVLTFSNTRAYRSTNYGSTWTGLGTTGLPTTSLFLRNINVARSNGNVIGLVANGGRVFLSNNGGTSWAQTAELPNNGLSLSYIHFNTGDQNTIYVASVAPDSTRNHLWRSTDFGATWTAIDGGGFPTGVPVDVIKNDPNSATTLYAGTHLGVYRSTDGGATWARFGNGLPLVEVSDLYISNDSTLVRAATYGRGYWELTP
jgi:photosystem II stability/assembly factor-like uncharacterized protein